MYISIVLVDLTIKYTYGHLSIYFTSERAYFATILIKLCYNTKFCIIDTKCWTLFAKYFLGTMEVLPDTVLLRIFSFIPHYELCLGIKLTCWRWYVISLDSSLWKTVKIASHISDTRLLQLAQLILASVESLDCGECELVSEAGLKNLFMLNFARLKHIVLPLIGPFDISLYEMLSKAAPQLQVVNNVESGEIYSSSSLVLQSLFANLEVVVDKPSSSYGRIRNIIPHWDILKKNRWVNDILHLSTCCQNICVYKCFKGHGYLDNAGIQLILSSFPKLNVLEFHSCSFDDNLAKCLSSVSNIARIKSLIIDDANLTDEGLQMISLNMPNLIQLKLNHCPGITNTGIMKFVAMCSSIRELYLNNSSSSVDLNGSRSEIEDSCVQAIGKCCKQLNYFRLFYSRLVSSDGIIPLLLQCRYLMNLMLFECPSVNDSCLPLLANLPLLRMLTLISCDSLSPSGLLEFALGPPENLVQLTFFTGSKEFYGDIIASAETACQNLDAKLFRFKPSCLRYLTVRGVSGAFLQLFCSLCSQLLHLEIRNGNSFTATNLISIVKSCKFLRYIDFSAMTCLDDNVTRFIYENCLYLESLHLGCAVELLSIASLIELCSCCYSLKLLTFDNSRNVVNEELLLSGAKYSHEGHCMYTIDKNSMQTDDRLVELHMVPLKYIASLKTTAV